MNFCNGNKIQRFIIPEHLGQITRQCMILQLTHPQHIQSISMEYQRETLGIIGIALVVVAASRRVMKKIVLPDVGSYKILGIDPGSAVFGVAEMTLDYKWDGTNFYCKATLDDYYAVTIHSGSGSNENTKLLYIHRFFRSSFNTAVQEGKTCIAYLEDVPFARSMSTVTVLHRFSGAIQAALLDKGWGLHLVNVSTWKAEVVGNGHAKKHEVMEWATGGTLPVDPETLQEDAVDAICIAYLGMMRISNQLQFYFTEKKKKVSIDWGDF